MTLWNLWNSSGVPRVFQAIQCWGCVGLYLVPSVDTRAAPHGSWNLRGVSVGVFGSAQMTGTTTKNQRRASKLKDSQRSFGVHILKQPNNFPGWSKALFFATLQCHLLTISGLVEAKGRCSQLGAGLQTLSELSQTPQKHSFSAGDGHCGQHRPCMENKTEDLTKWQFHGRSCSKKRHVKSSKGKNICSLFVTV